MPERLQEKRAEIISEWRQSPLTAIVCIFLLGLLIYSNTTQIPWYFDDFWNIVDNPQIRDLGAVTRNILSARGLPNFSFALNYHLGGFEVTGYHLVNIALHLFSSVVVFFLLKRVFSPGLPALSGALLFLLHPLQTQTVNYVVQRMTGMAACFFLLSLYLFVRWRESTSAGEDGVVRGRIVFLAGAFIFGVLAFLSKQNTVVLPFCWVLFDYCFLTKGNSRPPLPWRQLLIIGLPLLGLAAFFVYRDVVLPLTSGVSLMQTVSVEDLTGAGDVSPLQYLFTEFSVLWLYLRLMILPYGQMLDYGYPVVDSLLAPQALVALAGLVVLGISAWKTRLSAPRWTFFVAWFFMTLAVESSFIPLDPVFEHRLYLPMFGLAVLAGWGVEVLKRRRIDLPVVLLLMVVLSLLSWQRNRLWRDPVAFWRDNVVKSEASYRAVLGLADALMKKGAEQEAVEVYRRYLPDLLKNPALSKNPKIMLNVGVAFLQVGELDKAEQFLRLALFANRNYGLARYNLGVVLYQRGDKPGAFQEFEQAAALNPQDVNTLYNLSVIALENGERSRAEPFLKRLESLDPKMAGGLRREFAAPR